MKILEIYYIFKRQFVKRWRGLKMRHAMGQSEYHEMKMTFLNVISKKRRKIISLFFLDLLFCDKKFQSTFLFLFLIKKCFFSLLFLQQQSSYLFSHFMCNFFSSVLMYTHLSINIAPYHIALMIFFARKK